MGIQRLIQSEYFLKVTQFEQLAVRIDDKLSRVSKGHHFVGDNDIDDLIGYLVLLKVARSYDVN